jgi:hypothetical protein
VRQPIALFGKVFCKVDAQFSAIAVGELLTTSPTPGHAMATNDSISALGAVIGKALRPFPSGQGLIPILMNSILCRFKNAPPNPALRGPVEQFYRKAPRCRARRSKVNEWGRVPLASGQRVDDSLRSRALPRQDLASFDRRFSSRYAHTAGRRHWVEPQR